MDVRDEPQRAVAFEANDREIPPVGGEDGADVFPLGEVGEGGVGELQAVILVALHHRGDGGQIGGFERQETEDAVTETVEELVKARWPRAEEPRRQDDGTVYRGFASSRAEVNSCTNGFRVLSLSARCGMSFQSTDGAE